jgi:hypothetical protein
MKTLKCFVLTLLCAWNTVSAQKHSTDEMTFGNPVSEKQHQLKSRYDEAIKGGLGQTARRLLPSEPVSYQGGSLAFVMKTDPEKQNYFTVKLWGEDQDKSMTLLFSEGEQVGYRHLGDIDFITLGNGEKPLPGRFYYVTIPIPLKHTRGKKSVNLEIRSYGEIWGYGETFERYQKKLDKPTLGFYKAYVHVNPAFSPSKDEVQGKAPVSPPLRQQPGEEILVKLKERVNTELKAVLAPNRPLNQLELMFVSAASKVTWTLAYKNPEVPSKVVEAIDAHYAKFLKNPDIVYTDPNIYNYEWLITGPIARSILLHHDELHNKWDEKLADGKSRKDAWAAMLKASLNYSTTHRRHYTNQSMIIDMFMYDVNKALTQLRPDLALPETQTLNYLYESVGLQPWLGRETPEGPEKPLGDNYWQLTAKGLTKELGFVGYYGEVLDWVVDIYKSTSDPDMPGSGDPKIREQLLKMFRARLPFRYPALDNDGNKAVRIEAVVGWRDAGHYPGNVLYGDRGIAWDASPLMTPVATMDPQAIGVAQQMMADNQLFKSIEDKLKLGGIRVTKSLIHIPDEYEWIRNQPATDIRLPMNKSMPDFVFSDEEDGVIAVKNGDEILYASLYWRARNSVNKLAKVHYITPSMDRIANIYISSEFDDSGMRYTRPNWVNLAFNGSREFYPGIVSAHAGEQEPISRIPEGVSFKPGDESVFAGKANYYVMEYGPYWVAMNSTKDRTFELEIPAAFSKAVNLVDRKVPGSRSLKLLPGTTVVLYR